jgi:hypothetical protein
MATFQRQQAGNGENQLPQALEHQRRQVENLARLLQQQATDQWRKAIEGLVALPAAVAVGSAATALYAVGFVTRGFEVFQRSAIDAGTEMEEWRGEQQRITRGDEERGRGNEAQQPRA